MDSTDHVKRMQAFLDEEIVPAEARYATDPVGVAEELKAEAKRRDLWNLFRPGALSNVDFAPVAELTGWSLKLAPEAVNAMAPDVENMIMLDGYATHEQRSRWLDPLLDGAIRSAFTVAEPDVASSDVTGLATTIRRDGEDYVITGRKYFIANAPDARCRLFLVMGRTDADAAADRQHSILLVDRDTPGLEVVRPLTVFGFDDHHGYAEVALNDVRVPADALLGAEGQACEILRSRQGAGRIHYCMRLIGAAERAIDLMVRRARDRVAFGKPLAEQGVVREQIAHSRMEVDQARLLVLRAAALLDQDPGAGASAELAAIKVVCPRVACDVIDRAIQIHGGAGVSDDTPLAFSYAYARTIRMAFGPDAIDVDAIAGAELAQSRSADQSAHGAGPGRRGGGTRTPPGTVAPSP